MFDALHRWAIEVDPDQSKPNLEAQRLFIRDFGGNLYAAIDRGDASLSSLRFVYFTRIYDPARDQMGTYVRLHFFVENGAYHAAETELEDRLERLRRQRSVFAVKKETIDGLQEAERKDSQWCPELYYRYVERISRLTVELFSLSPRGDVSGKLLWSWTHNLFNVVRGYPVGVIEFPRDIPLSCWNV